MNEEKVISAALAKGVSLTALSGAKFKRGIVSVNFILKGERQNATALAILPHVLERRCRNFPDPVALSHHLYMLYGAEIQSESQTVGKNRMLTFSISGLKNEHALYGENLAEAYVDLLCDFVFDPFLQNGVFAKEDVEIEKAKQADYLKSEMNDKGRYCAKQARRRLYGDAPQAIESAGYLQDIPAISPESLYAAYCHMLQNAFVEICICGIDTAAANIICKRLETFKRTPGSILPPSAILPPSVFEAKNEKMETAQCKISLLACRGKIEDAHGDAVMHIGSAVFGGLPTSRLFVNVREKQGLCYYCSASYSAYSGVMAINLGTDHEDLEKAAAAVLHELKVMQTEPISAEELENAIKMIENACVSTADSPEALLSWVFNEKLRGTNRSLQQLIAEIKTVTVQEVCTAMAAFVPAVQHAITQ